MNHKMILLTIGALISNPLLANSSKSAEQKTLEVFDGWCVKNIEDFSGIDRLAKATDAKKMSDKFLEADPVMHRMGGSAYAIKYENEKFIVSYANGGACAVLVNEMDFNNLSNILQSNYTLGKEYIDTQGVQISKFYKFIDTSFIAGSIVSLSYAKPETGYKVGTISLLPKEALDREKRNNK